MCSHERLGVGCYVSTIGKPHEYFDLTGSAVVVLSVEEYDRLKALESASAGEKAKSGGTMDSE